MAQFSPFERLHLYKNSDIHANNKIYADQQLTVRVLLERFYLKKGDKVFRFAYATDRTHLAAITA